MAKYVIDTCALINAAKNYNMEKKAFAHIWETLDRLVTEGILISSVEVLDELKDDDILSWSKERKSAFLPLSREIQETVGELLAKHPDMIKISSKANSNADPFLIATSMIEGGTVVTDEKWGIPKVCSDEHIPCISLNEFLDVVLE